jgi:ubiquinone/menaquinone biosynthesis C-methylase UbiE
VLKPGGRLMVLEFSQLPNDGLQKLYDLYSFNVIPRMGQVIAGTATVTSTSWNRSANSPIRRPSPA